MTINAYYCFIDEKKLTEAEWNEVHAKEVANRMFDECGYWHCNSYTAYSASFDRCMADQIEARDSLRKWYVRLMKEPFSDKWAESLSDFSDCFKSCYGYRPRFLDDMLATKGITRDELSEAWERNYKACSDAEDTDFDRRDRHDLYVTMSKKEA